MSKTAQRANSLPGRKTVVNHYNHAFCLMTTNQLIAQIAHIGSSSLMFASHVLVSVKFYLHLKPSAEKVAAEENEVRPETT